MAYIGKSPTGTGVRSRYYFTASGGETSLSGADDSSNTLVFSDGNYVDVSLNGIALVAGTDYNTSTANTIAGLSALSASDIVEIVVYDIFTVADTVSAKDGGTFSGGVTASGGLNVGTIKEATGTTTAITIDSSGRVFKPATPAFHAYANDGAYITTTPVQFDNTTINVGNAFDTTNYKYVVPVTGNYFISVHLGLARDDASDGESLNVELLKDSTRIQRGYFEEPGSTGYVNISFSAIHALTAGDELTVVAAGGVDYFAAAPDAIFSGYLIG